MYAYANNESESRPLQSPPQHTLKTDSGDEEELNASATLRIGRRRSSVRLIPVNSIDQNADDRQSANIAHSKREMRRRSSALTRQQILLQRQQHQQMLLAQQQAAATARGVSGQPQRQPSMMGGMRVGQPIPQPLPAGPYVRQPARRPSQAPAVPPQQQQQQQPQHLPAVAKEETSLRKVAPNLSGPPPGAEVKRRGSLYRPVPQPRPQQQTQPQTPQPQQRDLEPAAVQSARRPSVLAGKAKQQSRRQSKADTPAFETPSAEESEEEEKTPPPAPSFTKRLSRFFMPSSTHRRKSKGESEAEEEKKKKRDKDTASDAKQRRKSNNSSPVTKLSAVEESPRVDVSEKVLEELDSTLAKREKAMTRGNSVRRTQSFFGEFSNHKADYDDDYDYDSGAEDDRRQVSSSSASSCDSATPDGDTQTSHRRSGSPEWDATSAFNTSATTANHHGHGEREADDADDEVSRLPRVGSDYAREERYSMENEQDKDSSSDSGEESSSSTDDEAKAKASNRPLVHSSSPGADYMPSSFFHANTSLATNGASPSPPTVGDSNANERNPQTQQQQQQSSTEPQLRAQSVPFIPPPQQFRQPQQWRGALPPIQQTDNYRRQTVPTQAQQNTESPTPQQPQSTPQQMQKRVSMAFPAQSMPNASAMARAGSSVDGFNPAMLPPQRNSIGMLSATVPPPNAAMMMNAQRSFMMNPAMQPMMMRYPMHPQGYPMAMQQQQQPQQQGKQ